MSKLSIKKKIILGVVSCAVLVGAVYLSIYLFNLKSYREKVASIHIQNVDLSKVKDGTYTGSYDAIMVAAEVNVTVKDGKITDIKLLKHKTERGQSAEVLPQKVVGAQSLEVDTVSGATNSSKVILKSIESALEEGMK